MRRLIATFATMLLLAMIPVPALAQGDPVARGVLFYSTTCGHCHIVINDHLPGIFEDHGGAPEAVYDEAIEDPAFVLLTNGTLELLMVNVGTDQGAELYQYATVEYRVPDAMLGVPRLVMGGEFHVGSGDIPASLPGLIETGIANGGMDWPALTGLPEAVAGATGVAVPTTTTTPTTAAQSGTTEPGTTEPGTTEPGTTEPGTTEPGTTEPPVTEETTTTTLDDPFPDVGGTTGESDGLSKPLNTVGEKFRNDPAGNTLAVIVLAGMLMSLALVWVFVRRGKLGSFPGWLVPLLAAVGVVVAVYLTYVETSGTEAVCGPVGNCNAVQQSKFALLFGVIHVGLVGLISYAVVVATWLVSRLTRAPLADWARVALALGAAGGVAFSIYLTFLEPFVIGSTCLWCLSSAIIVTALLWITAGPGWESWKRLRAG